MIQDTMPRRLFSPEHDMFRDQVRRFIDAEVLPYHDQWDEEGVVSREVWEKAGAAGMLCPTVPEEYGGAGADYLFSVVVMEEMARVGASGPGFSIHSEMPRPIWSASATRIKNPSGSRSSSAGTRFRASP